MPTTAIWRPTRRSIERPLASFSADATPAIVDALPGLRLDTQRTIRAKLERRFGPQSAAQSDWRTFNVSRDQAREAVARTPVTGDFRRGRLTRGRRRCRCRARRIADPGSGAG